MDQPTVLMEDQGAVRLLTLNRPQQLNALNETMGRELMAALGQARQDDAVAVVVITGAGRAFSAGGDLQRFHAMAQAGDFHQRQRFTDLELPRVMANFPKPLIAAINGPAVGWGFTMPLLCDLRLASQEAVFSCAFVRVGLTPEFGSSYILPRMLGLGRAMELVLTAREFGAAEALALGFLNRVTAPGDLLPAALDLAQAIARHPQPAIRMAKAILRHGAESTLEQTMGYEIELFRQAMATPEHLRAVEAMLAQIRAK
ncbi:MAG: enoyl-CoA hydratase/isomerase family protein [Desulfarculus sp.]|nr:enoyl-CoA hydratase/isomerase family protein [Desulfarculus sp.]